MNDRQIANLQYQLSVIEQIDTDILIYGDDIEYRKNLENSRYLEVIKLRYTMEQILK